MQRTRRSQMGYLQGSTANYAGLGEFGCGQGCGCKSCSSHSPELSQTYEPDEALGCSNQTYSGSATAGGTWPNGRNQNNMTFHGYPPRTSFGAPPPAPLTCPNTGIPPAQPITTFTPTWKKMMCRTGVSGEPDPGGVIGRAVARA